MLAVALTLLIGVAGWLVARRLGLSAPAMLGSMLAAGITNALFGSASMLAEVRVFAQSISGAFIAMSVRRRDLAKARKLIAPVLILFSMLTINALLIGIVPHLVCRLDIYTALLGSVACGVTDISMIAMDFNADASEVALLQTSRLVAVLLFFRRGFASCAATPPTRPSPKALPIPRRVCPSRSNASSGAASVAWCSFTMGVALAFGMFGKLSGIPPRGGTMVCALFGVAALNLMLGCCHMPMGTKRHAQLLAGSLVGSTIGAETFSSASTSVVPALLLFASYWLVNFLFTQVCRHWRLLDVKSAMFASAPGGASDIALIAADLDADLAKIAAIQIIRAVCAAAVMPTVVLLFAAALG